jgi:hypothetical protein
MHQLIASYLFQNKTCPLPGLGILSLTTGEANAGFSNKIITAPAPAIHFEPGETNAVGLLSYVAGSTTQALDHFCDNLKKGIGRHSTAKLEGIGDFVVNSNGDISFVQVELPGAFLQPVTAERIVHPEAEHSILVGDKETTNTLMTGYFSEEPVVKDRWWIWAIVLGLIGLIMLLIYFNDVDGSPQFGNAIKS